MEIKPKNAFFNKGLKTFSKIKQTLYIEFLINKTAESEEKYKTYKNRFEKVNKKSNKNYHVNKHKDNE